MNRKRPHFTPTLSMADAVLESRIALSTASAAMAGAHGGTHTTVAVSAGTLGQPVTMTVTVRGPAADGAPTGTVNVSGRDTAARALTLTPIASSNSRFAYSDATLTITPQPGGPAYFFGRHSVTAQYVPGGGLGKSAGHAAFTVGQPHYTTLAGGVKVATIAPGTGPAIQSGQTATMLYTGYLARGGKIFDDSANHGGAPFSFTLGAGAVIPGFDAGTAGMKAGETRIVEIPPTQGYGHTANGPIPANSTLIFVLTLQSIS